MGTYTPKKNLYKPGVNEVGWGTLVDNNWDILDNDPSTAVTSVFGRTGTVVAGANDYAAVNNLLLGDTLNETIQFDTAGGGNLIMEAQQNIQLISAEGPQILLDGAGTGNIQLGAAGLTVNVGMNVDFTNAATVKVPTPATADNSTNAASTAFVKAQAYAPLASPALTGVPTAPTATGGTNTTQIATTAFVQSALSALSFAWSSLQNATASLTLANGTNNTTFNQTSAATWTWANTTLAIAGASQNSPILTISGQYWTGSASATDSWTIQDVIAAGTNGTAFLTFTHSGSTGIAAVQVKNLFVVNSGVTIGIMFKGATAINGVVMQDMSTPSAPTDMILFKSNGAYQVIGRSTLVYGWASATALDAGGMAPDTGLSRSAAGEMAIGTGAQGSAAGNLKLNKVTGYNAETTAGPGVAYMRGSTLQKAETGADANVLTVTPAAATGLYRITIVISVSAASAATLGWTATWTDSNGIAQAPTNLALNKVGVAAPALTFSVAANDTYSAEWDIDVNNAGTNIVIKTTFSGTSVAYKISATIERLA